MLVDGWQSLSLSLSLAVVMTKQRSTEVGKLACDLATDERRSSRSWRLTQITWKLSGGGWFAAIGGQLGKGPIRLAGASASATPWFLHALVDRIKRTRAVCHDAPVACERAPVWVVIGARIARGCRPQHREMEGVKIHTTPTK